MSYNKAINQVLEGAGFHVFEKKGQNWGWRREGDNCLDEVVTYLTTDFRGVWVDLRFWDWTTRALVYPAEPRQAYGSGTVGERLDKLMGDPGPFGRSDPDGPQRAAAGVRDLFLPLFDRLHTPDGLMAHLAWVAGLRWGNSDTRAHYAVLLWLAGEQERACRLLDDPPKAVARLEADFLDHMRKLICDTSPPVDRAASAAAKPS